MDRSNLRESIKVIRQVGEDIKKGRIVVIFPEATRSKQGNIMGEFKGGSFKAAQNAKAPIVPVAMIDCFKPFDTKGLAWVDCQIHYLAPIYFEEYQDLSTQEIADLVKSRIQAKMDEVLKK
jgi:1-acyl-sn-glycerol-3-phosphate acyltransferase